MNSRFYLQKDFNGSLGPKSNYYKMKFVVENFCFNTLFTFNVENIFIFVKCVAFLIRMKNDQNFKSYQNDFSII